MPGLEEGETVWRYRIQDPEKFDKFRVKELGKGVKITLGRVKGTDRWEIQNYMLEKKVFKTKEKARKWLEQHLRKEVKSMLDYKAWNEYRRRVLRAFLEVANLQF
ncbi:MAG: hypothetical protein QXN95_00285 [Candidatus Bathyarchaeia archaeon]